MIKIIKKIVGPLQENAYILYDDENDKCILIDPGANPKEIDKVLVENNLKALAIMLTHGHHDHVGAVKYFQNKGCKVYMHKGDLFMSQGSDNISFASYYEPYNVDVVVEDLEIINICGIEIKVMHTPGHTKGSVCYIIETAGIIFSGDTIFYGTCGRTDFPGGSIYEMIDSFQNKIFKLKGEYEILPGHGPSTTLSKEKMQNEIKYYF